MKATELMIGDFVIAKNYGIKEIIGIKDFDGVVEISDGEDREIEIPFDDIESIPLTAEILEKNGWEDSDETLCRAKYVFIMGEKGSLTLNHWGKFYTILCASGNREIRYVHELQHALRLCGLDELANEFKI